MMNNPMPILLGGLGGLLVVASLTGRWLAAGARSPAACATVANLNARIRAWWVMVAVCGLAFVFGQRVTLGLFALTSFLALREFISLTPTRPEDHRAVAVGFYLLVPLQYALIGVGWLSLFVLLIPVWGFLVLPVLAVMKGETQDFLARTARVQWALMLCVFCISHAPALLILDIPGFAGRNVLLLFFLMVVVQLSDVLQYVFGKLWGRHRLAPRVSPAKTWEGLLGGGAVATLAGAGLWWITPFSPVQAGALALAIVVAGVCGGLVLSAVKRSLGAKDWGTLIEGHGGMLDRMDSVSFAAPVFFHLVNYFFAR